MQNLAPAVPVEKPEAGLVALDSALQEQERIITMSYTLASEASLKSKLVAGRSLCFYTLGKVAVKIKWLRLGAIGLDLGVGCGGAELAEKTSRTPMRPLAH